MPCKKASLKTWPLRIIDVLRLPVPFKLSQDAKEVALGVCIQPSRMGCCRRAHERNVLPAAPGRRISNHQRRHAARNGANHQTTNAASSDTEHGMRSGNFPPAIFQQREGPMRSCVQSKSPTLAGSLSSINRSTIWRYGGSWCAKACFSQTACSSR